MIEELHRFIQTAQERNITRTAEKIFITQSALSQSLKRLEKELNTTLFTMQGKHLQLTSDGQAVVAIGSKILQLWENAKDPTVRTTSQQSIALGLFDNAALRLGKYLQQTISSKSLHLELTINASGKLYSQLQWGILDAAVCVIDKRNVLPKSIVLLETFQEELIPVSSKLYRGDVQKIPFILYNQGSLTREQISTAFTEQGILPTVFAESTSTTFMKELAILGNGVALLPKNFIASELSQGLLKKQKLPFKITREYGLYMNTRSNLTEDHRMIQNISKSLTK